MSIIRILPIFLLALSLAGCATFWDIANQGPCEQDMRWLLENKANVRPKCITCHMIDASRSFLCQFQANKNEIARIVQSLELQELTKDDPHFKQIDLLLSSLGKSMRQKSTVKIYGHFFDRDEHILLKEHGSALAPYFILLYEPETKETLIESCYSYG